VKGDARQVEHFLSESSVANVNGRDAEGRTPLYLASMTGRADIVKLILAAKSVDPSIASRRGLQPLHESAQNGHDKVSYNFGFSFKLIYSPFAKG